MFRLTVEDDDKNRRHPDYPHITGLHQYWVRVTDNVAFRQSEGARQDIDLRQALNKDEAKQFINEPTLVPPAGDTAAADASAGTRSAPGRGKKTKAPVDDNNPQDHGMVYHRGVMCSPQNMPTANPVSLGWVKSAACNDVVSGWTW